MTTRRLPGLMPMLADLQIGLRSARRSLARQGGFTALVIGFVGVGIGLAAPLVAIERGPAAPIALPARVADLTTTLGVADWSGKQVGPEFFQTESLGALLVTLGLMAGGLALIAGVSLLLLLLSRSGTRSFEMAVRASLGYSQREIWATLAMESLVVGGIGLMLGGVLGWILLGSAAARWPAGLPLWSPPGALPELIPWALVAVGSVLAFGQWSPSRSGHRKHLARRLAMGLSRGPAGEWGDTLRRAFLVIAAAVATLVLTTATLLTMVGQPSASSASASALSSVATTTLDLRSPSVDPSARQQSMEGLLAELMELDTVRSASVSSAGAPLGIGVEDDVVIECGNCVRNGGFAPIQRERANFLSVSPSHFDTLGIRFAAGQTFEGSGEGERVAIVNRTFARQNFEGGVAVGRNIQVGGLAGVTHRVVGVVEDRPGIGLGGRSAGAPTVYLSAWQHPPLVGEVAVRTEGDVSLLLDELPLLESPWATLADAARLQREPAEWLGGLLRWAGWVTLLFALASIHSIFSQSVRQRRWEISLRKAVGATNARVSRLIVGEAMSTVLIGSLIGMSAAGIVARALRIGLPEIAMPTASVMLTILMIAMVAAWAGSWIPARRAATLNPADGLRR